MGEKRCCTCKIIKPIIDFHKNKTTKDGFNSRCRACKRVEWEKEKNSPVYKIRVANNLKKWRALNPEKRKAQEKRGNRKKIKYGLTIQEREKMIDNAGVCAICGGVHLLCIDHSHATGRVRGVLCRMCNSALGLFKDSERNLQEAIKYLGNTNIPSP